MKKLLKKKIDFALEFFEKNINKFRCPICFEDLFISSSDNSLKCSNNHTFDISKRGSVQLVNKFIKSDYDAKLFQSRFKMMTAGLFNPIFNALSANIDNNEFVVDAGSGEGSALIELSKKKSITGLGLDLSSQGIQFSTRGLSEDQLLFAVSNLANIPLKDSSVDTIINLLSPASYDEFKRVLKPGGRILKVIPNAKYLTEIRQFVSKKSENISESYDNSKVLMNLEKNFRSINVENIDYNFELSNKELKENMFSMTPLTWNLDEKIRQEFVNSDIRNVTVNLQLLKIDI
ncbi:putative RNA methyltransferase [Companilactobacillus sp. DQM5]|uniref:putative RNA methyltransferase n=1 Tax=Companilactobacillus sp. DQM5 TaxID=3463359 RepID=UPI0040594C37